MDESAIKEALRNGTLVDVTGLAQQIPRVSWPRPRSSSLPPSLLFDKHTRVLISGLLWRGSVEKSEDLAKELVGSLHRSWAWIGEDNFSVALPLKKYPGIWDDVPVKTITENHRDGTRTIVAMHQSESLDYLSQSATGSALVAH